jgi:hypothetical protein
MTAEATFAIREDGGQSDEREVICDLYAAEYISSPIGSST